MAVSSVGLSGTFNKIKVRAALTDVFAGAICSILSVAYCLSYAALIFAGPVAHLFAYGVAVTFLSAAVGGSHRGMARFACFRHRRTGQFDFRRHRRHGRDRRPAHHRAGWQRPSGAHPRRHFLDDRADRFGALCPRLHACRTRHPLRALPGDRRVSRRHRLADDHGRSPGRQRSAPGAAQSRCFPRSCDRSQARRRVDRGNRVASGHAPVEEPVRHARCAVCRIRGDLSFPALERAIARAGASRRLDVPAAAGRASDIAVESRRV